MLTVEIAAGTPRISPCGTCRGETQVTFDMHLLTMDGPVVLGTSSGCGDCRTGFFADDLPESV